MTWYTTKVLKEQDLVGELQRLDDAAHTIFSVILKDGTLIIISHTV